eukprot:m51a1_g6112 hypothetical protein (1280) ;mRNA; f:97617-105719
MPRVLSEACQECSVFDKSREVWQSGSTRCPLCTAPNASTCDRIPSCSWCPASARCQAASDVCAKCSGVRQRNECQRRPGCRWCTESGTCAGAGASCTACLLYRQQDAATSHMDPSQLDAFEGLCAALYTSASTAERRAAEDSLRAALVDAAPTAAPGAGGGPDALGRCAALLQAARTPYAQVYAATAMLRAAGERWLQLSPAQRADIRAAAASFLWQRAQSLPPNFVLNAVTQLYGRVTKWGWDTADPTDVLTDARKFLESGSASHAAAGLLLLADVVREFSLNMCGPPGSTTSRKLLPYRQRQLSISFRDSALFEIFSAASKNLEQICAAAQPDATARDAALKLLLACLSYDFSGSGRAMELGLPFLTLMTSSGPVSVPLMSAGGSASLHAADELQDDVAAVPFPERWRAVFQAPGPLLALLFGAYARAQPPASVWALECVLQLVAARRSMFVGDAAYVDTFVGVLLTHLTELLTAQTGLQHQENHHALCRTIMQLKSPHLLEALTHSPYWSSGFFSALVSFTHKSLKAWQWASNSVHYLLSFWAHLVVFTCTASDWTDDVRAGVADAAVAVLQSYDNTRIEAVAFLVANPGAFDDPLSSPDLLSEHMTFAPILARAKYDFVHTYLVQQLDGMAHALEQAVVGGATGDHLEAAVRQLSWVVRASAAAVRGRGAFAMPTADDNARDGDLALRCLSVPRLCAARGPGAHASEAWQQLRTAGLFFAQQLHKAYLAESASETTEMHERLAQMGRPLAAVLAADARDALAWGGEVADTAVALISSLASCGGSAAQLNDCGASRALAASAAGSSATLSARSRGRLFASVARLVLGGIYSGEMSANVDAAVDDIVRPLVPALEGVLAQGAYAAQVLEGVRAVVEAVVGCGAFRSLVEWMHPRYTQLMMPARGAGDASSAGAAPLDPALARAALRLASELSTNREGRMSGDACTSPVQAHTFRAVAAVCAAWAPLLCSAARLLGQSAAAQADDPAAYNAVYRPAKHLLKAAANCYGQPAWAPVGTLEACGDTSPREVVDAAVAVACALPTRDVCAYPKLARALFGALAACAGTAPHLVLGCGGSSPEAARAVLAVVEDGLRAYAERDVAEMAAGVVADLLAAILAASQRQQGLRTGSAAAAASAPQSPAPEPPLPRQSRERAEADALAFAGNAPAESLARVAAALIEATAASRVPGFSAARPLLLIASAAPGALMEVGRALSARQASDAARQALGEAWAELGSAVGSALEGSHAASSVAAAVFHRAVGQLIADAQAKSFSLAFPFA